MFNCFFINFMKYKLFMYKSTFSLIGLSYNYLFINSSTNLLTYNILFPNGFFKYTFPIKLQISNVCFIALLSHLYDIFSGTSTFSSFIT